MSDNLFTVINPNIQKTISSSLDLRLLDVDCNHKILNETTDLSKLNLFKPLMWGNSNQWGNGFTTWNDNFDPNQFIIIKTQLPLADNNSISLYELPISNFSNPTQETVVIKTTPFVYKLMYPPVINSTSVQLKTTFIDTDGTIETVYFPFTNYTLSQLTGTITFTTSTDFGSTVLIEYVPAIRKILPKTKNQLINWQFLGYDQNNLGIFKLYAGSFLSSDSSLVMRYTTNSSNCPRCGGKNTINDLKFDENGRLLTVFDFSKLIQDFFKRFLTEAGSNPFDISDGTQLSTLIGAAKFNPALTETFIKNQVVNVLNSIRQKQQTQIQVQGISLAEQIQQINSVTVIRNNNTDVTINIEILSKSGSISQLSVPVKGGN